MAGQGSQAAGLPSPAATPLSDVTGQQGNPALQHHPHPALLAPTSSMLSACRSTPPTPPPTARSSQKLSQWYWLSLGQEVTTLVTGEPCNLPQELFQEMREIGLHHHLSAPPAGALQLEM